MTAPRFLRSTQSYQISTTIEQEPSMTRTFSFNPEAMIRRVAKASGAPNASLAALKFGVYPAHRVGVSWKRGTATTATGSKSTEARHVGQDECRQSLPALDIGKATLVHHCQPRGQLWQLSRRMGSKWVAYGPAHHIFGQKGGN
ncbi:hypothetical protein ACCO45_010300 [Purpureocillium lilacinum]|uniref:Uncharacterized protein n=1 Tax=Purpureocillium lilacinum TaxID=33203 RepID=A0ACC4DFX2_PURLI